VKSKVVTGIFVAVGELVGLGGISLAVADGTGVRVAVFVDVGVLSGIGEGSGVALGSGVGVSEIEVGVLI
jgi:hypothetical protein